jgi:predicted nucleic acid-binding protein
MSFVVDTNMVSELARRSPNPGVVEWARRVVNTFVSVVTIEEVQFGLSWKPNPRVLSWFEGFIENHCEVLSITPVIAIRSGQLRGQLQAMNQVRRQADMLIAATASVHALTVVTRNVSDFEGCGVSLFNPFSP